MCAQDRAEAAADRLKGNVKEVVGETLDDDGLAAEGRLDQAVGQAAEATEKANDVAGDLAEDAKGAAEDAVEKAKDAIGNATEKIKDLFSK